MDELVRALEQKKNRQEKILADTIKQLEQALKLQQKERRP